MRRIVVLAVLSAFISGKTANADPLVSDPYAKDPSSTLSSWPVLYKLPPSHKAHYYAMGWCGLCKKGPDYQKWYDRHSQFNVNALPEVSWEGKVKSASAQAVEAVNDQGKSVTMVIYPSRKVSDVHVVGPAETGMLKVGKYVRFVGKVDEKGRVSEPVSALELYTPLDSKEMPIITAGNRDLVAGCLVRQTASGGWEMRPARKGQFHKFEFATVSKPRVTVDVAEVGVVKEGQKVTVHGRLWDEAAQAAAQVVSAGPGYFQDPSGALEAQQAELAAEAAKEAAKGNTTLVPIIFACRMVIQTGTDDVDPNPQPAAVVPSQLQVSGR